MPIFHRYLFADYSGGGEDHEARSSIRLYQAANNEEPARVHHVVAGNQRNFSRNALRERIRALLNEANEVGHRVVFGQDHQYGWPPHLRLIAGLNGLTWREAVLSLAGGNEHIPIPALDIPRRYCGLFNNACGQNVFWTPLHRVANLYGIPIQRLLNYEQHERFRLTERAPALQGNHRPKPADAVGGKGEGIVGGQTICGLRQINEMLEWHDVAWWPFDGLDINGEAYIDKHVAIEIYPSALRPAHVPQNDDNDAQHSCEYVRVADQQDQLVQHLNLAQLHPEHAQRVTLEGWIVGMDPQEFFLPNLL